MLIDSIYKEHGYINRIVQLLESKLERLEGEKPVNYNVIREGVDYLSSFAENTHHPKENMIYQYYIEHYGKHQELSNLIEAHHRLSQETEDFSITIDMILNDAIVPKDIFKAHLKAFTQRIKRHIEQEEKDIFPFLIANLTSDDWLTLESGWEECDDPVFGNTVNKRYQNLASKVR